MEQHIRHLIKKLEKRIGRLEKDVKFLRSTVYSIFDDSIDKDWKAEEE